MKKQSRNFVRLAAPAVILCGLLAPKVFARDEGQEDACSNRTLRGDFGFTVEGVILPKPGVSLPIRGVALTHFDGRGNLTQVDHIVFDGLPPAQDWTPGIGSYHINGDCTGTVRIDVPSTGDFLNLRVVVVKDGKEIRTVVTAPFNGPARTVTSLGIKVE